MKRIVQISRRENGDVLSGDIIGAVLSGDIILCAMSSRDKILQSDWSVVSDIYLN